MAERAHPDMPDFQDKWFGLKKNPYKKALVSRYRYCNGFIKGKIVLDIPCGVGWGTSMLRGARHITGVDISEEAVEFANNRYGRRDRIFIAGNMSDIPVESGSVDVVLCLEGFEHVRRDIGKAFIGDSLRVLKPGGLIIMTCPILKDDGTDSGNPFHLHEYREKDLISILNDSFSFVELKRIDGPDGPIIRFVGRKLV